MTAHQHPEELIDRARHGALDRDAQSALDAHLALCGACAAHVAQGPHFERELAPQPRDEALDRRAVQAAMSRLQKPPVLGRGIAWPRWFRLAVAGVLLASVATASAAIVARTISSRRATVDAPVLRPAGSPPARVAAPAPAPTADVPGPAQQPPPSALASRPTPARPPVTAAALFERAGNLRRDGRADAAIAIYRRLQETFPDAREAPLSFALAGQLLLERGRPSEALAQFDRHPQTGGDAGEEALAGRAAALEQLHRTGDAIAAWKTLLGRHPGSVYAARARARLAQLGERR